MTTVTAGELMARLSEFKTNPTLTTRVVLESLGNTQNIVDATNPFVFLLEASTVNTASFQTESELLLRRLYPSLAQSYEDLYLHMSDADYLDRFSKPAETEFTIMVALPTLEREWLWDPNEACHKVTIPRNSKIEVDGYAFLIEYPIHIRKFATGQVQIAYDAEIDSPITELRNSIIDYVTRTDDSQVVWLDFKIPMKQLRLESIVFTATRSVKFSQTIPLKDRYHYARVYHRSSREAGWQEMATTHSDQVFDPMTPTAVLTVFESTDQVGALRVEIPVLYQSQKILGQEVRVDIYTTKGAIQLNLDNYMVAQFVMTLTVIDPQRDDDGFVAPMAKTSFLAVSNDIVVGGTDPIGFEALRERVMTNGVNGRHLPISNVQLTADVDDLGFDLVRNTDVVTNRLFLAIRKLPEPSNRKLLTPANIGIMTLTASVPKLIENGFVAANEGRVTLLPTALYRAANGIMTQLRGEEIDALEMLERGEMVTNINSNQYLYTPYYYVLDDTNEEFAIRAYDLDRPRLKQLSFESQNETLQLVVNTAEYSIQKNALGYEIVIRTKSGSFYRDIEDRFVGLQLGFIPPGETRYAYINARLLGKDAEGNRIFSIQLETNHDVDADDRLYITNAQMSSGVAVDTPVRLDQTFDLFHYTHSISNIYVPTTDDAVLGKFLMPGTSAVMARERIRSVLGYSLRNLWSRGRSVPDGLRYKTYEVDVPAVWPADVYDVDPITGAAFEVMPDGTLSYHIVHRKGDPIFEDNGEQRLLHARGDVVLDNEGNPIPVTELSSLKEFDMLMVDARYRFATDSSFRSYKTELAGVITDWVTETLETLSGKLLEQTRVYFYPKTTLSMVQIYPDGGSLTTVSSEQSFTVDLYVPDEVYADLELRQTLEETTVRYLDSIISNSSIVHNDIIVALRERYGQSVTTFTVAGLGGRNYQVVHLAEDHNRMCLRKRLVVLEDLSTIIREDVTVNFHTLKSITKL